MLQYKDEIVDYTAEQCVDSSLWPKTWEKIWIIRKLNSTYRDREPTYSVEEYRKGSYISNIGATNLQNVDKVARSALKTLLKKRIIYDPQDYQLSIDLCNIFGEYGANESAFKRAAQVIAEYRVNSQNMKHGIPD